jgi:shikimate dehydrogenase
LSNAVPDRYAVIGHPISHSLSPFIHSRFAKQTGHNIEYGSVDVAPHALTDQIHRLLGEGYRGLNVTMPHKSAVLALCDDHSAAVREAGAANTLIWDGGSLRAETTDGPGLMHDLEHNLGAQLLDASILIVGAGGSTYSILGALLRAHPGTVVIANRTARRAHELVDNFAGHDNLQACGLPDIPAETFNLVINATSASVGGTRPDIPARCVAGALCYDLMYKEDGTPFTHWCQAHNASAVHTGIGMLVAQAAFSFNLWRGVMPDQPAVLEAISERFSVRY